MRVSCSSRGKIHGLARVLVHLVKLHESLLPDRQAT